MSLVAVIEKNSDTVSIF